METQEHRTPAKLPRVAITFCTGCKWMLRAAYYGQELLSTFGTTIGEIALIPTTGGIFTIKLTYKPVASAEDGSESAIVEDLLIWDFATERCFPETKLLKQKVRNLIAPGKGLGHSDKPSSKSNNVTSEKSVEVQTHNPDRPTGPKEPCEDCT